MARIAGHRTLGEVRGAYSSKPAFNKAMRMDARARLLSTGVRNECIVCGETRQVDICHIRSISSFDDAATIDTINGPDNNVVLCPLHHRLLDNDMIDMNDINIDKVNKGLHIIFEFNSVNEKNERIPIIKDLVIKALKENNLLKGITFRFDE